MLGRKCEDSDFLLKFVARIYFDKTYVLSCVIKQLEYLHIILFITAFKYWLVTSEIFSVSVVINIKIINVFCVFINKIILSTNILIFFYSNSSSFQNTSPSIARNNCFQKSSKLDQIISYFFENINLNKNFILWKCKVERFYWINEKCLNLIELWIC